MFFQNPIGLTWENLTPTCARAGIFRAKRPMPRDGQGHGLQHIKIFSKSNMGILSKVDLKIFPMLSLWENARAISSKFRVFPGWWLYPAGRSPARPQFLKVSRKVTRRYFFYTAIKFLAHRVNISKNVQLHVAREFEFSQGGDHTEPVGPRPDPNS